MGGQAVDLNNTRSKTHAPEKNGAVNVRRKRHGRNGCSGDVECQNVRMREESEGKTFCP